PGPHCSQAWARFLFTSSDAGQLGIPARLSAMFSSNCNLTLVVSLVPVKIDRTRTPSLMFSSVEPIGGASAVVRSVPQESLPAPAGGVHVGTTGGAAAELAGKAIKPTPRAAAEHKSSAMRLLVRMYGSPPCVARAASNHPCPCAATRKPPFKTREGRHQAAPLATSLALSSLGIRSH